MLTPLQERFCQEYLVDLNAAAAYRRATARPHFKHAGCCASHMREKPHVKARIAQLLREREARTTLSQDWVLARLKEEATFKADGASHAARVAALGLLMKHLGMLVEDAPHPDRPRVDLTRLTDEQKRTLLAGLRLVLVAPAAGRTALPAGTT